MKRESNLKTHTNHCVVSALLFTREQSGQAISETISLTVSLTAGALPPGADQLAPSNGCSHIPVRARVRTCARSKYEYE